MRIALTFAMLFSVCLQVKAEIPWTPNLKTAHQKAQAEGKLLLVHFESENCTWCDRLNVGVFQSPEVGEVIEQTFVPVRINASQDRQLAEYFKVARFPTDVVVDSVGAVHSHMVSPQAPAKYIAMLRESAAKSGRALPVVPDQIANVTSGLNSHSNAVAIQSPQLPPGTQYNETPVNVAVNGFALPPQIEGGSAQHTQMPRHPSITGASGQLVSSTNAVTGDPHEVASQNSHASNEENAELPPLAMDGYCPVSILEETEWAAGSKAFGAIHLGRLYLFVDATAQAKFLEEPDKYTPALGGLDVVKFINGQQEVAGSREYGLQHEGRLYFFSSEESLTAFFQTPQTYSVPATEVMRQATSQMRNLH